MSTGRLFLGADHLTETQQKILALAEKGMCPGEMRDHFPTFQFDSLKKICRHLRKRGYDIPKGESRPYKLGAREPEITTHPAYASRMHLVDLKRAGYTTFLYLLESEYRIKRGPLDKPSIPLVVRSYMGSPAAMVAAE